MDPADYVERIHELERELQSVKEGYVALDKNWESHHEACMRPIRAALRLELGTVPELVQKIKRMAELAELALIAHRAPSLDALPPGFGDSIAEAADAYESALTR